MAFDSDDDARSDDSETRTYPPRQAHKIAWKKAKERVNGVDALIGDHPELQAISTAAAELESAQRSLREGGSKSKVLRATAKCRKTASRIVDEMAPKRNTSSLSKSNQESETAKARLLTWRPSFQCKPVPVSPTTSDRDGFEGHGKVFASSSVVDGSCVREQTSSSVLASVVSGMEGDDDEEKEDEQQEEKEEQMAGNDYDGVIGEGNKPTLSSTLSANGILDEGDPIDADAGSSPSPSAETLRRKAKADAATRNGDYAGGLSEYDILLTSADALSVPELHVAVASNAALCALKLSAVQGSWIGAQRTLRRVVGFCDEALLIDCTAAKAHFRRGCALEALEDFLGAREAYELAMRYEPSDPLIQSAVKRAACYDASAGNCGRKESSLLADARARLLASDAAWRRILSEGDLLRRKANAASDESRCLLTACCICFKDVGEVGFYALPCSHGPFCQACRARVDQEAGLNRGDLAQTRRGEIDYTGLRFCPACRKSRSSTSSEGVISKWREGGGELIRTKPIQVPQSSKKHAAKMPEASPHSNPLLGTDALATNSNSVLTLPGSGHRDACNVSAIVDADRSTDTCSDSNAAFVTLNSNGCVAGGGIRELCLCAMD
eukprot:TRINITY_DN54818_c0_g1_i1.p1 TRINITY_DN54818_c0_g1~~TRINITY_DN54818_c0_g1_i1.p1  ORF type:complete len:612 (-),score=98.93 TRINITY_DN54818_c0_g1_i1:37-1872(-)